MELLPKNHSPFGSLSFSCELHKNSLEYICLNQFCLEKGLFFCCSKCLEIHHKDHLLKLIKVDLQDIINLGCNTFKKSELTTCLSCLNDLNGKIHLILNIVSKSMMEKCQANQRSFTNSFERVFKKFQSEDAVFNGNSNFHSVDFKSQKIETPFFSKNNTRNSEFKNANQFYRDFSKKFEKFKKVFASLVDLSNKFHNLMQEFVYFMDETYNKDLSESTEESDKKSSFTSQKSDLFTSIFQKVFPMPSFHNDEILDLKFFDLQGKNSQKMSCLASCSKDKSIHFYDLNTRKLIESIDNMPNCINQMAFCEDNNLLAASLSNDIVKLWRYDTKFSFVGDIKSHSDSVWGLQFIKNGTKLISSSFDSNIYFWDLDRGKVENKINVHEGKVYGFVYLEDLKLIAVAGQKSIFIFDERDTKTCKYSYQNAHENQIIKLDYSKSDQKNYLASCSKDNKIKLWDLALKEPLQEFHHDDYVYGINFLNPLKLLASASDDRKVKIWSIEENRVVKSFEDHTDFVKTCQWNKESQILASAGKDKKIMLRYF